MAFSTLKVYIVDKMGERGEPWGILMPAMGRGSEVTPLMWKET